MMKWLTKKMSEELINYALTEGKEMVWKKLAAALGVGQDDIEKLFDGTLDSVGKQPLLTKDQLSGVEMTVRAMIDVLRDEDVMESDTKKKVVKKLEAWLAGKGK